MPDTARSEHLLKPYQAITDRIIAFLEAGVVPWRKPWHGAGAPANLSSGKEYRGVNVFVLTATAAAMGYTSPYWLTFRQALERGGNVRKGEKGTPVTFWKLLDRKGADEDAQDDSDDGHKAGKIPLLRLYHVFNAAQIEGVAFPSPAVTEQPFDPIIQCERIVHEMPRPPTIEHTGTRAAYSPSRDTVAMPKPELFSSGQEYYSTLFHELTHATGHPSRLNRDTIADLQPFGTPSYAKEELVAEMGAAFLCGRAGIDQETLSNSAAYINGWLAKLRGDPKLVVLAASAAQKAADFILTGPRKELVAEAPRGPMETAHALRLARGSRMIGARTLRKHFPELPAKTAARIAREARRGAVERAAIDEALEAFDGAVGGNGVEAVEGREHHGHYWQTIAGLYVNRGDTYRKTLVYDVEAGRFLCTSLGSFVEWLECRQGVGR